MSRRPLVLTATVATAGALLALFLSTSSSPPRKAGAPSSATLAETAPARSAAARPEAPRRATWSRYRLASTQRATLNGEERARVITEGTWTTMERAGGRIEAQLAASRIEVIGDAAPSAEDVADPIELLYSKEGILDGITFEQGTSRPARALLTGLATTFQGVSRPELSWTVEEEDLLGRYTAEYRRDGERVTRTRARYTALRDAAGLKPKGAAGLLPTETTEMRFDDHGLVSATVRLGSTMRSGGGSIVLEMALEATLVREATGEEPLASGPDRAAAAISNHLDHALRAKGFATSRVGGRKAPELLADAKKAAHLDGAPENGAHRAGAMRSLAALTEIDDTAAGAIADAIREHPEDKESAALLLGSLASSHDPSATNALASLLEDEELTGDLRSQVLTSLTLAKAPTPESAAALTLELDGASADQAALALGAQAHKLDDDEAGDEAIDALIARYTHASTPEERRLAVLALGNTGSPEALDVLKGALQSGDLSVVRAAAFALRLIPGDEVDTLLLLLIQSGSPEMLEAIQATGYRSAVMWRPRLLAAKEQFAGEKRVVDAIQAVLSRWTTP